ncbi:MAG: gliding motility-associated C-terminal domain-containing protein [Saprospiraceae bacterium]|nr:gliding motility-associated C-terminal domain-containing protein [Saprospiraceae bacterium]
MMRSLTTLSVIWFLCAFSQWLNAQETYLWNSFGKLDMPTYYEMYKFDVQTGDRQLLFRLDSIRFVHPNMTGNSFQIISFAFSSDRKTIYFLEKEGDLYTYDVANDIVVYIKDLTPGNVNFLWHNYHQTQQIDQLNDSLYYIGGATKAILNINNFTLNIIREIPSFAAAGTNSERLMFIRKFEKHKDNYLILDGNVYLAYVDLYDPTKNSIAVNQDLTPLGYFDDTNLISYQYNCDSTVLYTLYDKFYMGQRDSIHIDRVDLVTGQIARWKTYVGLPSSNFSTNRIRDAQHFNVPTWEDCQRYIDLDKDDNTALEIDYIIDSLCTFTNIPLSDLDIHINNEYPLDSIDIFILDPSFSQYMNFPAGNYTLKTSPNFWQRIINNGTTTINDYEDAIRNAYLFIDSDPLVSEIKIGFVAWYNGITGDTAIATIKIAGPLPNAGFDNSLDYCQNELIPNLDKIISSDADKNGQFYNSDFDLISHLPSIQVGNSSSVYYITSNAICYDTATINIKINPIPNITQINDTITCHDQKILIQLPFTADRVFWSDGSFTLNKEFNIGGAYHYVIKNKYDCINSDTFIYTQLPPPMTSNENLLICKDSVFIYFGKPILQQGIYSDTLHNSLDCDSLISRIDLKYFAEMPLTVAGDTTICEGEKTVLTVSSNHSSIIWNSSIANNRIEISEGGLVSVIAKDANGCNSEKAIEIVEHPLPYVNTNDMLDTIFTSDLELDVAYNNQNLDYIWLPTSNLSCSDCPYPTLLQKQNGSYIIKVINEYGCMDSAILKITFKESKLLLPNIISKNSSTNNVFYAQGSSIDQYDIAIYDRWGNKVFNKQNAEVGNAQDGWQPENSLSHGVYVYVITYMDAGEKKVILGDITLVE